jgi:hypothetical protein
MKLKIISDGTNIGTHLVDVETGERVQQIGKISWKANAKELTTTANVELTNIPVEIVSSAQVSLFDFPPPGYELVHSKDFQKDVKIVCGGSVHQVEIFDKDTNLLVGAIQDITWEATPEKREATINKIKFGAKDWV